MVMGERIKAAGDRRAANTMAEPAGGAARQPSGPGDEEPDEAASVVVLEPPDEPIRSGTALEQ